MSSGSGKVALEDAAADAAAFRSLFYDCHERWEVAGSVRRRCPLVGDIEHVVLPAFRAPKVPAGLFGQPTEAAAPENLLWRRLDELEAAGTVRRAVYPDGKHRWGPKYRGVVWRGARHEVFVATPRTWGAILSIRTGPRDFSVALVSRLRARGLRQGGVDQEGRDRTGEVWEAATGRSVDASDERVYLGLCGVVWVDPWCRDHPEVIRRVAQF